MNNQGNVLFLILIAVVIFAALSYAITQSSRGNGNIDEEKQTLDASVLRNCISSVETGKLRVTTVQGCADNEVSYELPDGSNSNPSAPLDQSCHVFTPGQGGASPCGPWSNTCSAADLLALAVGQNCQGLIYAGANGANRLYTSSADHSESLVWNNGSNNDTTESTGNEGMSNTNTLVASTDAGSPYQAAELCRSFGTKWFLPGRHDLQVLYDNRTSLTGFISNGERYATSTIGTSGGMNTLDFNTGSWQGRSQNESHRIRCVRHD